MGSYRAGHAVVDLRIEMNVQLPKSSGVNVRTMHYIMHTHHGYEFEMHPHHMAVIIVLIALM